MKYLFRLVNHNWLLYFVNPVRIFTTKFEACYYIYTLVQFVIITSFTVSTKTEILS